MTDDALRTAVFTDHARGQMQRRGLRENDVRHTRARPDTVRPVGPGRVVAERMLIMDQASPRSYLLRVFVDIDRSPAEVVTVYRTSKTSKYGSRR